MLSMSGNCHRGELWCALPAPAPKFFPSHLRNFLLFYQDNQRHVAHWVLDDGYGEITAAAPKTLVLEVLGVNVKAFDSATEAIRRELLQVLVCKEFLFVISRTEKSFRVDTIGEMNPAVELRRLMTLLKDK